MVLPSVVAPSVIVTIAGALAVPESLTSFVTRSNGELPLSAARAKVGRMLVALSLADVLAARTSFDPADSGVFVAMYQGAEVVFVL